MDRLKLAKFAAVGQLAGEGEVGEIAALRAGLEDAARAPHCVAKGQTLGDRLRAGFFAIDILAGPGRKTGRRRVPVWTRGDQHGIDVAAAQEFAEVPIRGAVLAAVALVDHLLDGLAPGGLHVADSHAADVRAARGSMSVVGTTVADTDTAQHDLLAGRHSASLPSTRPGMTKGAKAAAPVRPRNRRREQRRPGEPGSIAMSNSAFEQVPAKG